MNNTKTPTKKTKTLEFESAPVIQAQEYYEEVRQIVRRFGIKAAYITDESLISDFLPSFGMGWQEKRDGILKVAKRKLRIPIKHSELLIVVAKRLRRKQKVDVD